MKGSKNTSIIIDKINGKMLDSTKNYNIYLKAYKYENGKKVYLARSINVHVVGRNNKKYSNVVKVKVAKSSYRLAVGKKVRIKAKTRLEFPKRKQLSDAHAKEFRYATTDKSIATVSKDGIITARKAGTCYVYVYARNGYPKKIKVKVK